MDKSGRRAFWYHVILAVVCAGGGILLFNLGYRTYPVVALVGATAWLGMAVRSARDTETAVSDVEEGRCEHRASIHTDSVPPSLVGIP
ncbi:hypothetical protein ACIBO1_20335 [Micromonospora sp. NPDC049903]|uniref:hypothetical protein n=1 Tax=Micromonospora sp. NPDC049903 TaxID=3364276 RepID=UPI0037AABAD9